MRLLTNLETLPKDRSTETLTLVQEHIMQTQTIKVAIMLILTPLEINKETHKKDLTTKALR
jgi:hypothetical protein